MPIMRRLNQQLPAEQVWSLLDQCAYMTLSMADQQGNPYGVPLSFVVMNGAVYYHGALQGYKMDLIGERAAVCLTAVHQAENRGEEFNVFYTSVTAFGQASVVEDEEEKLKALYALCEKYAPGNTVAEAYIKPRLQRTAVVRIDVKEITGKKQDT